MFCLCTRHHSVSNDSQNPTNNDKDKDSISMKTNTSHEFTRKGAIRRQHNDSFKDVRNIYLERSWEATDIKEFFSGDNDQVHELSQEDLYKLPSRDFLSGVYFCSTDIVQHHLQKVGLSHLVPVAYESAYQHLLKRQTCICLLSQLPILLAKGPLFVKPYLSNKDFDGRVISSLEDYTSRGISLPGPGTICYVSEIINIVSEYRLLIGNQGKLYGVGHMRGTRMGVTDDILKPFLDATSEFRCVDIGFVPELGWILVEINPPFSLDDYDIPLNGYMDFCIDACHAISSVVKNAMP